eukprot:jgi/Astpho2/4088/Aster-x1197
MPHPSAAMRAGIKMVVVGGRRSSQEVGDVSILHTDSMKWTLPAVRGTAAPVPRHRHSAACARDKASSVRVPHLATSRLHVEGVVQADAVGVFIFGGQTEQGQLLNDVWEWHMDTMHWVQLSYFQAAGAHSSEPPSPRCGASLSASEDGRRLWLFGGNDGERSLADVFSLDVEACTWTQVNVSGSGPPARENHVGAVISNYLVISGGIQVPPQRQGPSQVQRLGDTQVMDITAPAWECLDEGSWATGAVAKRQHANYCAFHGNKLYTLRPGKDDRLDELQILEFTLPEDIERMKSEKKKGSMVYERLDLLDDVACSPNSIEVAWRPPTKNMDRILDFKLMMATTTGVVKDVYHGMATQFRTVGLRANAEYIFCVKANYDDGSFIWSESKAFTTKS